jgi:hypothetical protein
VCHVLFLQTSSGGGGGGGGGKSRDEIVGEVAGDILSRLPPNYDLEAISAKYEEWRATSFPRCMNWVTIE